VRRKQQLEQTHIDELFEEVMAFRDSENARKSSLHANEVANADRINHEAKQARGAVWRHVIAGPNDMRKAALQLSDARTALEKIPLPKGESIDQQLDYFEKTYGEDAPYHIVSTRDRTGYQPLHGLFQKEIRDRIGDYQSQLQKQEERVQSAIDNATEYAALPPLHALREALKQKREQIEPYHLAIPQQGLLFTSEPILLATARGKDRQTYRKEVDSAIERSRREINKLAQAAKLSEM
jgi:hypothetical protein